MSGEVFEWIERAERGGSVCAKYVRRLEAASNKSETFRVICDVNGGSWLFSKHAECRGVGMPIDGFAKEFANCVDGRVKARYETGYTSQMHVRRDAGAEILADTTLLYLLECRGVTVVVPPNAYPSVILSDGSSARIVMGDGARANVELYGSAEFTADGCKERIRVERK